LCEAPFGPFRQKGLVPFSRPGFVKADAVTHGIQSGLRFLSLTVGGVGLLVTALVAGPREEK